MKKGKTKNKEPIDKIIRPFQEFANLQASGGILLLICTIAALLWANSTWRESYTNLWHLHLGITIGDFQLSKEFSHWINDGLMAIFFFVVGMEIKRELLEGELSSAAKAALPIAAAIGGMIVPALLYTAFNAGKEGVVGWGIPMATDIAFAIGVVVILGNKVPASLRIFLLALAIVDDLGAVLVIAFFYTAEISWTYLSVAAVLILFLTASNVSGVRHWLIYTLLGIFLWYVVLKSGIHATIAGVLLAMTIPLRSRINTAEFLQLCEQILKNLRPASDQPNENAASEDQQLAVSALEESCEKVEAPLRRFEHALHPWVSFLIMPLFALANAGIAIDASAMNSILHPVGLGTMIGLVFGKQIGITLFSWAAVKAGFARLPEQVNWIQIYALSCLGGIGFTMSLFVAALAFGESELLSIAKLGILIASFLSAILGAAALTIFKPKPLETE